MKNSSLGWILTFSLSIVVGSVHAQSGPHPQMRQLEPLIGNWSLEGTAKFTPDASAMSWTGVATISRILDGHFVQEDLRLDIGMPTPLVYRTIYAWDPERRCFRTYGFGNNGEVRYCDVHWHDGKLLGSSQSLEDGVPSFDRWVTVPSGDTQTFFVERCIAGGEPFRMLEGRATRAEEGFSLETESDVPATAPIPGSMKKLEFQLGRFRLTGEMQMMPGSPMVPVGATETIRSFLGGQVHYSTIEGDPFPGTDIGYRGQVYLGWDARYGHYRALELGRFGERIEYDVRPDGDKLVFTASTVLYGSPQLLRSIVTRTEGGGLHMVSHKATASGDWERVFESTSEPVKTTTL
ncbi:MAG: DUF1579 family protein [Planctomycetes bacterium]|nr:DUF1579 family protein [Planctomycetota bacterium]